MVSPAERREELRSRLIDIAESTIVENGLGALKARSLAQEAGCAVGAIYNVFDDLTDLAMTVNGRTFNRLGESVTAALAKRQPTTPRDKLIAMGHAYLEFAANNKNAWQALFELEMSTDQDVPDWYLAELARLFELISVPLTDLNPNLTAQEINTLTRAVFSSVHGIVLLGLEKRISGVPVEEIEAMISMALSNFSVSARKT